MLLLLLILLAVAPGKSHADFFRYTDDKGVICITDNLSNVPGKYRAKVVVIKEEKKVVKEVEEEGGWVEAGGEAAGGAVETLIVSVSEYPYHKLGISFALYALGVAFSLLFLSRHLNRKMMSLVVLVLLTSGLIFYAFRLEVEESHRKFVKMKAHVEKVQQELGKKAADQAKAAKEVDEMLKELN